MVISHSITPRVCAVIVTFHPTPKMIENISSVLEQVAGLVVVDNGSNPTALASLREVSLANEFHLIENEQNLGIAEALNQGVRWAIDNSYPWVVLFDQDSKMTPDFMRQMFAAWTSHPQRERAATIQPKYVNPETGIEPVVVRAPDGGPFTSMTSGALMPVWIFEKIGFFESDYFIDLVDCEYSLRIRATGYTIIDSREASLLHTAGHPQRQTFLGFSFQPSNHSAMRRYYMSRNRVVVYRKYLRIHSRWVLSSAWLSFRETVKCFVAENNRTHKLRNFLLGTWDGLTGRMGKREGI